MTSTIAQFRQDSVTSINIMTTPLRVVTAETIKALYIATIVHNSICDWLNEEINTNQTRRQVYFTNCYKATITLLTWLVAIVNYIATSCNKAEMVTNCNEPLTPEPESVKEIAPVPIVTEDYTALTKAQLRAKFPRLKPSWTKSKMLSMIAA